MNYFKTKTYLLHHLRLQPSEIENMPYYEYVYHVDNLIEILKEKQKTEDALAQIEILRFQLARKSKNDIN